jgi:hypothetical protein
MKAKYAAYAPKGALKMASLRKASLAKASLVINRALNAYRRRKLAPARSYTRRSNLHARASVVARAAAAARAAVKVANDIKHTMTPAQIRAGIRAKPATRAYNRVLKRYANARKTKTLIVNRASGPLLPLLMANTGRQRTPHERTVARLQRPAQPYGFRGASWDYHDTNWVPGELINLNSGLINWRR